MSSSKVVHVCRFLAAAGGEHYNQVQQEYEQIARANITQEAPYIFVGPFDGNGEGEGRHFSKFSIFLKFPPRGFSGSLITNMTLVFGYKTFLPRYWQHVPRKCQHVLL
jgi:hypothetical protein